MPPSRALINFTLVHGFFAASPLTDLRSSFHGTLQAAIDECGVIWPCAGLSLRVDDAPEGTAPELLTFDPDRPRWYELKRFAPRSTEPPPVFPSPHWRSYVRADAAHRSAPAAGCEAHECAGAQLACSDANTPRWSWAYRAPMATPRVNKVGFLHVGGRSTLHLHWNDGSADHHYVTLLPGARAELLTYHGALWRVRRPPPSDEVVREYLVGRALVQDCECARELRALGIDAAAASAASAGGDARACAEAAEDGTEEHGPPPRANASARALLDVQLFNSAATDARVVRVRWDDSGEPSYCLAGELPSGQALLLQRTAHADVLVACPYDDDGAQPAAEPPPPDADLPQPTGRAAACERPLLVHAVGDAKVSDCDGGDGGAPAHATGTVGPPPPPPPPPPPSGETASSPPVRLGDARAAELERLERENEQLRELLASARSALAYFNVRVGDAPPGDEGGGVSGRGGAERAELGQQGQRSSSAGHDAAGGRSGADASAHRSSDHDSEGSAASGSPARMGAGGADQVARARAAGDVPGGREEDDVDHEHVELNADGTIRMVRPRERAAGHGARR